MNVKKILKKIIELTKNTTVRVISLLLLLCFIASLFVFPDFYKQQIHKIQSFYYVYKGDRAYKKRLAQDAINNYTKALSLHPKHTRARYNLANLYVAYEDYVSALENYRLALELKPDFTVARIDYAIVLSEATFNYDLAIEEYDLAIKKRPKSTYIPFIINSARTFNYNKGVAYYNKGLAWRGKSLLYGKDRFQVRQYLDNAVKSYNEALKSFKGYDVYYNLGIANQLLRRNSDAGKSYCKAIELEPMNYEAHYNLAILLKTMKEYKASAEEFQKAGLLMNSNTDVNKTRYLYDVLNEVNQILTLNNPEYLDTIRQEEDNLREGKVTYINGKLVISEDFDKAMFKNFKTCSNKEKFDNAEEELEY